jgi:hypothetical protein
MNIKCFECRKCDESLHNEIIRDISKREFMNEMKRNSPKSERYEEFISNYI